MSNQPERPVSETAKASKELIALRAPLIAEAVERVCDDFSNLIAPMGFKKTVAGTGNRSWYRQAGDLVESIYFDFGLHSHIIDGELSIVVRFSTYPADAVPPFPLNGPCSDDLPLRAYHLRFNALTWSNYEQCLADLARVLSDHGLPWFAGQHSQRPLDMDTHPEKPVPATVKAGKERVCDDFSKLVVPMGFKRTRAKSRVWRRQTGDLAEEISFDFGRPVTIGYSVSIRVYFSTHSVDAVPPFPLNGPCSDNPPLRDEHGYAYHLRFNALTWSTYDRCLADLARILNDHGLPWFAGQHV